MQVPQPLATAFGKEFQEWITQFALDHQLISSSEELNSPRFLARSVVPHIVKLSGLFNRIEKDQGSGLDPYWKQSSNPENLRLAYFLYFMPSNLFRVSSIWAELSRLGFQWEKKEFRAIEFGAGPASGACGIAAGEKFAGVGLPKTGSWALIEQDRSILELGSRWAQTYFSHLGFENWGIRPFHRKLDPSHGFLPPKSPQFNLWLMSFYLNEIQMTPQELAPILMKSWADHLENEGIVILVEPALKLQSRKLLELRQELLKERARKKADDWQILLPCLGHQACGALSSSDDWCHEEVSWWRPPYFRTIDQMAELDRKTLPFSYLVIIKSRRPREEILPKLAKSMDSSRYRLVSPAHSEGRDLEFFVCGQEGKRRARYRPAEAPHKSHTPDLSGSTDSTSAKEDIGRGDILLDTEIRGDTQSSRITQFRKP